MFVDQAVEAMTGAMNPLNPTQPDYHARMSAGAKLVQLIGANPPKSSAPGAGPSQVAVVIEMPEWARPTARLPEARVISQSPAKPA